MASLYSRDNDSDAYNVFSEYTIRTNITRSTANHVQVYDASQQKMREKSPRNFL